MKANKTMREMMVAASLLAAAACGSVESADDNGDMIGEGSGSDGSGSGSEGMGDEEPTACSKAADCDDGQACDLETNVCVTGMLTLDASDFVDDGLRWWTNTTEPTLRGTFVGPAAAVVQVIVGTGAGTPATLSGNTWSVKLAPGAIGSADTLVKIMMTDPSGGLVVREQIMAFDAIAPVIAVTASKVRDERGDVIDFSSGEPVHDHQGPEVDLGGGGCPTIYKHAYLMDEGSPAHGSELTPNPFTWRFGIADARVASADYRILTYEGTVLLDWGPLPIVGGLHTAELSRDGLYAFAGLGTDSARFRIEVRATDWSGNQGIADFCWTNRPLGAPLKVEPAQVASGVDALMSWSLLGNHPISRILNAGTGAAIIEQRFTQYTAEDVYVSFSSTPVQGTYEASKLVGYVATPFAMNVRCGVIDCSVQPPVVAVPQVTSGTLSSARSVAVFDDAGVAVPSSNGMHRIPGLDDDDTPRTYTVRVYLNQVSSLRPGTGSTYGEHTIDGVSFTGNIPAAKPRYVACTSEPLEVCTATRCTVTCGEAMSYNYVEALDSAKLMLGSVTLDMRVAASSVATAFPAHHVAATAFQAPAFSWDAGNDDLPGAH